MYYFTYDPWVGKQLYLEDFYVMDQYRGTLLLTSCHLISSWGLGSDECDSCRDGHRFRGPAAPERRESRSLRGGKNGQIQICVHVPTSCSLFQLAIKMRCTGMMFVVAENNEPSIQFYKRRGAEDLSQEEGWRLFKFNQNSLVKMAAPAEE